MSADFFEPGHVYAYEANGFTAPELVTLFRVVADTVHPETGARVAFGWIRPGDNVSWSPYAEPADDWPSGWSDVTDHYEEKATASAATATPHVFIEDARLRALHDAMTAKRGEWRSGDALRAVRDSRARGVSRGDASRLLRALVEKGLATAHGPQDGRFYTLSTSGKDDRA